MEFSIVGLSIVLVGLFTLQLGLLYVAKTTLNYAVFEAARAGAVNNASMNAIREELGIRLAPLQGGDGSEKRALLAIAKSSLNLKDPLNTKVVILNPTKASFRDWSVKDPVSGKRFIPVNHLRHQTYAIGRHSGLSLRDANLLKLQVTHGVDLRVPIVGKLLSWPMIWIDSQNAVYYSRDKWPIQAVATVRMQSDSFEEEILKSAAREPAAQADENARPGLEARPDISGTPDRGNTEAAEQPTGQPGGPVQPTTPDLAPCEDEAMPSNRWASDEPAFDSPELELVNTTRFREMLAENAARGSR